MKHDTVLDHVTEVMMCLLCSLKIIPSAYLKKSHKSSEQNYLKKKKMCYVPLV